MRGFAGNGKVNKFCSSRKFNASNAVYCLYSVALKLFYHPCYECYRSYHCDHRGNGAYVAVRRKELMSEGLISVVLLLQLSSLFYTTAQYFLIE